MNLIQNSVTFWNYLNEWNQVKGMSKNWTPWMQRKWVLFVFECLPYTWKKPEQWRCNAAKLIFILTVSPLVVTTLWDVSQSSVFLFPSLFVGNLPDWPHAVRKTCKVCWCSWWWNWSKLIKLMQGLSYNSPLCVESTRTDLSACVDLKCLSFKFTHQDKRQTPEDILLVNLGFLLSFT